MDNATVYMVVEPDGSPKYIGKTIHDLSHREGQHLRARSLIGEWMRKNDYIILGLEECDNFHACSIERSWIWAARDEGFDLLNKHPVHRF